MVSLEGKLEARAREKGKNAVVGESENFAELLRPFLPFPTCFHPVSTLNNPCATTWSKTSPSTILET